VRHVGLVHFDLGFEHAHIADREERRGIFVERAFDRRSPCWTISRVTLPLMGARMVVLFKLLWSSRSAAPACSTRNCAASVFALATSSVVRSCSNCSSEMSCAFVFLILRTAGRV